MSCSAFAVWGEKEAEKNEGKVVENGRTVSIEYTMTLEDGRSADSNVGQQPLVYQQGSSEILPALEQALVGLRVDDIKVVTLPPEQAYGVVNPDAFKTVSATLIPEESRRLGARLLSEDETGNTRMSRVHRIGAHWIILDMNHPLAGHTLRFDVKIVAIE